MNGSVPKPFDPTVPAASRRYNAWLGGKDNFASDRASADEIAQAFPSIRAAVAQNRLCRDRMVRYLAAERGIRQFLDIGCGLPLGPHVHEIAQEIVPRMRIVYVDNDPLVAVHARALMLVSPEGEAAFHDGDLCEPRSILEAARDTLDFSQPIGLLLAAVLHFLPDTAEALAAVRDLVEALPAGSHVALTHATYDPLPDSRRAALDKFGTPDSTAGPFQPRTREEVAAFVDGLDLLPPGLVSTIRWRPELQPPADSQLSEADVICYAVIAVKC
ncbi:SAM-dependent methyltransferase [Actinoplanes sp. CA-030573]|uniref:SAM-dependent methyltransferase n=1 Tax=Actinoplanes sp. CA-030573 TaxID=3239898 RepID=UPI003D8D6FEF